MDSHRKIESAGAAWDDFKDEGVADIKAALEWCRKQSESFQNQAESIREHRPDVAKTLKRTAYAMRKRAGGLEMLLNYITVKGPDEVPLYEDFRGQDDSHELEQNISISDLQNFLSEQTIDRVKRDHRIKREFWTRRDEGDKRKDILHDLTNEHNLSEKAVESIVYPREE